MKLGVVRFCRKIRSMTASPTDEFVSERTLDAEPGPRPMSPDEEGLSADGTTLTIGKRANQTL